MFEPLSPDSQKTANRDMNESQRRQELRKFYAPCSFSSSAKEEAFNESLKADGALTSYAETVVWRLHGTQAMISLMDEGMEYFLAGAIRTPNGMEDLGKLLASLGPNPLIDSTRCSMKPISNGLCENTMKLGWDEEEYPFFIIEDLSKDARFCDLEAVNGTLASYRFYAGTPITTKNHVNIGSFFMFDNEARLSGLTKVEKKFMHEQAGNIMKHLENLREAHGRHRAGLMTQGISKFLERDPDGHEMTDTHPIDKPDARDDGLAKALEHDLQSAEVTGKERDPDSKPSDAQAKHSTLDKIRSTLDQAALILRESFDLVDGGVVFLDAALGYTESENTDRQLNGMAQVGIKVEETDRQDKGSHSSQLNGIQKQLSQDGSPKKLFRRRIGRSTETDEASKVLAVCSVGNGPGIGSHILDNQALQILAESYPKGNIWYLDEEGYFSSLEQISSLVKTPSVSPSGRRRAGDIAKQSFEAQMLVGIFTQAKQIMFIPMWDAAEERWYSGCFVWSRAMFPVLNFEADLANLSAFTSLVMVEVSRLDTITSDKMKSDFISSISHEMRSPLHGILACAESLRGSRPLDDTQLELVSDVQNCGTTLLDTIEHVLDYSEINSFEKAGKQGTISNELCRVTNVALLCEEIVTSMIAAIGYRGPSSPSVSFSNGVSSHSLSTQIKGEHKRVETVLDMEARDWDYVLQAGAFRRVVMNVFGNAQKYTESGHILVQLRMLQTSQLSPSSPCPETLYLCFRDSGCGMSTEFMERKLFHPFSQEDCFASGVGLGLSIVRSILKQLGGKISIHSEVGRGTTVDITLPIIKTNPALALGSLPSDSAKVSKYAENCLAEMQSRAVGQSIRVLRTKDGSSPQQEIKWSCIERYCSDWFGFDVKHSTAPLMIIDTVAALAGLKCERVLIIHDENVNDDQEFGRHDFQAMEHTSSPIGPFKLARRLLALMDRDPVVVDEHKSKSNLTDSFTQTPLGTPEDRALWNGMIAADYQFRSPATGTASSLTVSVSNADIPQNQNNAQPSHKLISVSEMTLRLPPSRKGTQSPTSTSHPSAEIPLATPVQTEAAESLDTNNSLHILAVDDNHINLKVLHRQLKEINLGVVVTAINGLEAVEAVRNAGANHPFDAILTDIAMPKMNGFDATRAIRAYERELSHETISNDLSSMIADTETGANGFNEESGATVLVPSSRRAYIVALTGQGNQRDRDEAAECGIDEFYTKPYPKGRIEEILKRMAEKKRLARR